MLPFSAKHLSAGGCKTAYPTKEEAEKYLKKPASNDDEDIT